MNAQIAFRGAWIATVANIDWPSTEAVGNDSLQKAEMVWILDSLQSLGINAVIFQVRPTADALYQSEYEPSSHWLMGKQGDSLTYDPLAWTIEQAHERHIEVHVWLNPYRVNLAKTDTSMICADHIWRKHPEWFWEYNKQWYFNPGLDVTREWICTIVQDIVYRYDIQAIHMDDYFYPYPAGGKPLPDVKTFEKYPRGFDNIENWRRDNVNRAIQEISATIHECKDSVQFGISPFGVWRNASVDSTGSKTTAGITNYDDLYADIRLWIREGWIDYVLPQLYWEIGKKAADYETLAHWWANEVRGTNCKLYIGMAPYRLEGAKKDSPWGIGNEISRQMKLNRTIPEISGECFYSTRPLLRNPRHVCDTIKLIYKDDDTQKETDFLPWE
ncbi:MAG: family 10 glycosylhydrolase [Bacteroidales bacterium]|nr:family 10 glycosylhydrolase [Bacteroidales bacterium]MDY6406816.1 family 10 glycosylhydrolase [Bacteroidales bacterium]